MKKFVSVVFACAAMVSFAAEVVFNGNSAAVWSSKRLTDGAGIVTGTVGYATIKSKDMIPVEAGKKYVVSGEFRLINPPEKAPRIYFGFYPCNAEGREISYLHVTIASKNILTVVKDVKAGDTSITLKGLPQWNPSQSCYIAFNVKEDKSDLPNFDISPALNWKEMKKNADGTCEVPTKKPFARAYAAGTSARLHQAGVTFVYAGFGRVGGEWVKFTKEFKTFYPGTTQIKLAFNAEIARCQMEMRNVTVTAE
ncbi:MAG: hypothetical protein IJC27_04670 [Lentisphaeria bacterium]|nr:hypothetical protein [Lentisphaeria bacterium]